MDATDTLARLAEGALIGSLLVLLCVEVARLVIRLLPEPKE